MTTSTSTSEAPAAIDVSVLVCTRNRASSLPSCLESINVAADKLVGTHELIVIDNGSSDGTRELLQGYLSAGANMKAVVETKRGLAAARNRGLAEARGDLIAFTDDDCIVDPMWLENIRREFHGDATLGSLGGRVILHDPRDAPVCIKDSADRAEFKGYGAAGFIHGCNMAFRRQAIDAVGEFDTILGAGAPLRSAEDTDFVQRVFRTGYKVLYTPGPLVRHAHGRRTKTEVDSLNLSYAYGRGGFYGKHILRGDVAILKHLYWEMKDLAKNALPWRNQDAESRREYRVSVKTILLGVINYYRERFRCD